jgi:hypothetical protein
MLARCPECAGGYALPSDPVERYKLLDQQATAAARVLAQIVAERAAVAEQLSKRLDALPTTLRNTVPDAAAGWPTFAPCEHARARWTSKGWQCQACTQNGARSKLRPQRNALNPPRSQRAKAQTASTARRANRVLRARGVADPLPIDVTRRG